MRERRSSFAEGEKKSAGTPEVYLTVPSGQKRLEKEPSGKVKLYRRSGLDASGGAVITVDADKTYQTIDGFGASITDTAAYALFQLPQTVRDAAMVRLFDPEKGIGLCFLRNPIGTSDFARTYYTYDDLPQGQEDRELKHFSIAHDLPQIIPLTKQAMRLNPRLKVMGSPWTAPLWMKTESTFIARTKPHLRHECYGVYANYLIKYIQAYAEQGIPVFAITPQNEPEADVGWPGMIFDWQEASVFVNEYLRPALTAGHLDTKIFVWDWNWDGYTKAICTMAATMARADGVAFHHYGGSPAVQSLVQNLFPDKGIYMTEGSFSAGSPVGQFLGQMKEITDTLRNYAKIYLMWNLALDEKGGPEYQNINSHCTGLVVANKEEQNVRYNPDFYSLGHYSKFIRPGAVRVESTDTGPASEGRLTNLTVKNPDGTRTAVLTNTAQEPVTVKLADGDIVTEYTMPQQSAVTIVWNPEQIKTEWNRKDGSCNEII